MKLVRWIGHPSPFGDPNIVKMLVDARLPIPMVKAFQRFEHNRRLAAVPGKSEFLVGPAHGFSRTYRWLPGQELEVTEEDYALLTRHPLDRYMFLDVTDLTITALPVLTKRQWQELIDASESTAPPVTAMVR